MTRINLVLLLAVVLSAIYLVNIQYESRRLFTELDKAQSEERRLASELDRLQVEKRAQATSARVEKLAREKLQMRLVLPAITTYVSYSEPPVLSQATGGTLKALPQQTASQGVKP
jgi:cell division protein FtsL